MALTKSELTRLSLYRKTMEALTTHVLVSRNGEWPVEEYHPVDPKVLPLLKKVWTKTYLDWIDMRRLRMEKLQAFKNQQRKLKTIYRTSGRVVVPFSNKDSKNDVDAF